YETIIIRKDGKSVPIELTTARTVWQEQPIDMVTIRDISERKRAEQEREHLIAELARKNKELEQIVYVTSHDLRSPLVNVQGFSKELDYSLKELASAIQSECVPADIREKAASILEEDIPESMQYIRASISKMDSLLSGLLRLSRLGRAAIKIEKLDMNNLISNVASTFEFQVKEADVKLEISELPPCEGDIIQINQVFSNLLGNALKFLAPVRPGIIRISGYKEKEQSVYCVEDNGIGIAPEHQEKIFEIFHKLEPAVDGQGLGLTIVSRILDRHTGNVWVESEPGKGSKFFVSLPNETNTL
ncbi:HAMP domain-containing histidine kinase, partial [bacterium]|nr:HAMP domain-containing histidine kinase [bacterium]